MTIRQNFSSSRGYPSPPEDLSASGDFYDMKNSVEFSADILLPESGVSVVTHFKVDIDRADKSTVAAHKSYDISNKIWSIDNTNNRYLHLTSISKHDHDLVTYTLFQDGVEYRILYEIYINHTPSGSTVTTKYKLFHVQFFRYFETPVTIKDFSFNDNVETGVNIVISGATLVHTLLDVSGNPVDETVPEGRENFPAIQFKFQEADIDVVNYDHENDQPAEYYTVDMSFNPVGDYILENNNLTTGKIYKVDMEASWKLGYYTFQRSLQNLYILNRPVITAVNVVHLAEADRGTDVIEIITESLINEGNTLSPSKIWFEFYDSSDTLVARAGGGNPSRAVPLTTDGVSIASNNTYSFSLNAIDIINLSQGIIIDATHTVKAVVRYNGNPEYQNAIQLRYSVGTDIIFANVQPVIDNIVPYDVQNDGGNDGVPNEDDADSTTQVIATVGVNNAAYKLYAPSHIKFNIYNSAGTTKLAETLDYNFLNSLNLDVNGNLIGAALYDIKLNEVSLLNGAAPLTNGTSYKVKAQVKLSDHSSDIETRESEEFTSVTFSQNVAPVPSVTITNTYLLNTNDQPSVYPSAFNASPSVGVSGYFNKTAQFGPAYSKQLDVTTTKFRIEYKLNNSEVWVPAMRAALTQRTLVNSVTETIAQASARISRAASIGNPSPVVTTTDGEYANVVGTGIIGTSQNEMVFYIPQNQGDGNSTAFTEDNTINVRVTVVDTLNLWAPGESISTPTLASPSPLDIIKKISGYDPTGAAEPWNSEKNNSLLYVHVNGNIVEVPKSQIKYSSNAIITELAQGWKVLNTEVGTNGAVAGALPKVNLYFYGNVVPPANQTSSNSFKVSQINGMGPYAIINHNQGAKEYPFITVYTTPNGSNDKVPGFYKSKLFYAPSVSGDTVADYSRVGLTLLYTGTDNPAFRPDIPSDKRVKMDVSAGYSDTNGNYANELVNLVSLQTSSNASTSQAGNFNFTLSETGLTTSTSLLSSLVMSFTKNLFVNIPVELKSSSESVKVGYKYDSSHSYIYQTFNYPSTVVSLLVDPNQGTTLYYSVSYIVSGVQGLTVETDVPNRYFPVSSDYTITNSDYKTFNTGGESSVSFDLTIAHPSTNRLDGVNVYFTSPTATNGSGIEKTRIGSYVSSGSNKVITLLDASGVILKVMDANGNIVNSISVWGQYDLANISFEAFRDARVNSNTAPYSNISNVSDPVLSNFYVETGSQSTFGTSNSNPIWNVPVLKRPADDASGDNQYELSGGVLDTTSGPSSNFITWPTVNDNNGLPFTYDLKLYKTILSPVLIADLNLGPNSYVLPIDPTNVAKYTIEITKVFNGDTSRPEKSPTDTIVFNSIDVLTEFMYVEVVNPSTTSSVTISWIGPSFARPQSDNSMGDDNIFTQYIKYRTDPSNNYVRLNIDPSANTVENGTVVGGVNVQQYNLPNQTLGTLYEFVMYIEAQVNFTVNGVVSLTESIPQPVLLTPVTQASRYRVSTIPSITLPHSTPVLVQGSSNPTLLLNLNATGLENEGFVSVVVILTQDGTASKPEGEQALLIFPDPNTTHPFSFPNTLPLTGGAGAGDLRLAGGESATSAPKNVAPSVLSTQSNSYTLTIGNTNSEGRYSLSTLTMPTTANSGFIATVPINYMVILTTRRGTDIAVGEFTYITTLPAVQNVGITTSVVDGVTQYNVNFDINSA